MNEDFALTPEQERKKLFAPPSRAMKCRQMLWIAARLAGEKPVLLTDLVRDHKEEFAKSEIYHAAVALVTHGVLARDDVSWAVITKGKERTRYRCAVRYVTPFTSASRIW